LPAYFRSMVPAGVSEMRAPLRSNSCTPSCCSKALICRVTAGCVRQSSSAALRKFKCLATARKTLRRKFSISVLLPDSTGQVLSGGSRLSLPWPIAYRRRLPGKTEFDARLLRFEVFTKSCNKKVRAVFLIDPESKVRALLYYPLSNGRNFQEIKRLLMAMQMSDEHKVATPADWQPGGGSHSSTTRLLWCCEGTRGNERPVCSLHRLVPLFQEDRLNLNGCDVATPHFAAAPHLARPEWRQFWEELKL